MLIAISGTPGTGKTTVSKLLAKKLDAKLISIRNLIENRRIKYSYDKKRETKEIDEKGLKKSIAKEIEKGRINIIEGHLSHLVKVDYIFVLRTNPQELYRRLKQKGWKEGKIKENVLAEFLDSITIEAMRLHPTKKVFEINTSRKEPKKVALLITSILNNYSLQKKYRAGKIDWTERYKNTVLKM